ncbi:MAG TPA: glycosyltransferase family 39 protein [Candidatus Acidoferrales bacterium]|nr:glycosyltransferase family 39 protein [Candidatus Acidoferrales bacterium]
MTWKTAKQLLTTHYPLIGVIIASFLVATSMATYTNWDSTLEYEAATNTTGSGFPTIWTGHLINQPPLGFYTSAAYFLMFGTSYSNGVTLTTVFGVAAVALVYVLGVVLYGRRTGLVASVLFGLIPWHVYMSRIFLIDNQSMVWSLLALVIGVLAVRRNSDKLFGVAGGVFALALLTKLYSVFIIPPLLLIQREEAKKGNYVSSKRKLLLCALPIIITQVIWYVFLAPHQNFLGVYFSTDFISTPVTNPEILFLPIVLSKVAGYFLFGAVALSVAFAYVYRAKLGAYLRTDLICLATIAVVAALSLLLVLGLHLTVPYVSVFKYTYMALPFFCLLAASITDKGKTLLSGVSWRQRLQKTKKVWIAAGFLLIGASLVESVAFLNTWVIYASFGVDSVTYYPLNLYADTAYPGFVSPMHYAGLFLAVASIALLFFLDSRKTAIDTASSKLSDQNIPV